MQSVDAGIPTPAPTINLVATVLVRFVASQILTVHDLQISHHTEATFSIEECQIIELTKYTRLDKEAHII